ncbi:MAG: Wzz/FepE/Etk N-terminal domain-containing protein [Agathobacter sp.]|nr:Wzz/FepE/Etk N-terminal domain-containing protein [Agathobacter sp.]
MERQFENDEEIEIDLKELFGELISNWKIILVSTIFAAIIGFSVSEFLITPKYESVSQMYVFTKSTSITSLADLQTGTSLTNDYMVVVAGRPVLEQVIKNLELDESYSSLRKKIDVTNPADSRILQISVTDEKPNRAKVIADEMAEVSSAFISQKMDQDPPTIIQYGYSDGEPVSPNIAKNTIVGGMIGFLLSSVLVIGLYILNDTIMSAEDVEKKLGLNVLGTLPLEEIEDDGEWHNKKKRRKNKKKRA